MQSSGAIAAPVRQDYSLFSARPGPGSHRRRGVPGGDDALPAPSTPPPLDFAGDPAALSAVAEALRLAHGHQFNPAFASETARIDPLPHQRIAVYERMLRQDPLRFLLADDAGAGKTIMTGLYVREMLSRGRIRRVLVVPPSGLVGNWERELRTLFRLQFRIVSGADARAGNPFRGAGSDLVIVSLDTLAGGQVFGALREAGVPAYDLVVFDEAHKLAAVTENHRIRKTRRYELAEALAGGGDSAGRGVSVGRGASADQNASASRSASPDRGVPADRTAPADHTASTNRTASADRFAGLGWSARHLLLLTATPHMGRDSPWHHLWRLLDPRIFSTGEALRRFPQPERVRHFIRRTKEEMVGLDGRPLYRQRACDTFSYALSSGPEGEQALYDLTTAYLRRVYNRALDNRPAVRLAMSVFQRRLASSTWALLRSFERRIGKLRQTIDDLQSGRMDAAELARRQRGLDREYREDFFDIHGAEDEAPGTPDTPGARGAGGGGPAAFARRRRGFDRKHREDFFDAHGAEDGAPDTPGTRDAGARNAGIRNASIRDTVTGGTGSAAGVEPADSIHAGERNESYEDAVLGAVIAVTVEELRHEIKALEDLGARARRLFESGRESKFEKLREVLEDPHHAGEKWLIFSEHRDTVEYLIRRLEGLGFSGRIAQIHGGMAWPEREEQVARFRRPDGARYLVATDAAGEGINLQFCRLMVNYDVPWNPARLEQRMGRIHRYGQQRDVRIVNLIAGGTHEGRVLKVLLEKLEAIRRELRSDKVFDVIGQLFENASLREYMIEALTAEGERRVLERVGSALTGERVRGIGERERRIYGAPPGSGEVAERLDGLRDDMERERYLQLLPGYVRRFVEKAAGLLDLEIRGDLDGFFCFVPRRAGALDPLLPALESYPAAARERLCVRRPEAVQGPTTHPYPKAAQGSAARPYSEVGQGPAAQPDTPCIWLHPGEPVFEALSHRTLTAFGRDALRGAIFTDPRADAPYFFHLAVVSVEREPESGPDEPGTPDLFGRRRRFGPGWMPQTESGPMPKAGPDRPSQSDRADRPDPTIAKPSNTGCWGFATAKTASRPNARSSICSCCTGRRTFPPARSRWPAAATSCAPRRPASPSGRFWIGWWRNTGTRCAPSCPSGGAGPSSASTFTPPTWPPAARSCPPGVAPERSAAGRKQTMRSMRSNGISDCSPPGRSAPSPGSMPRPIGSSPAASAFSPMRSPCPPTTPGRRANATTRGSRRSPSASPSRGNGSAAGRSATFPGPSLPARPASPTGRASISSPRIRKAKCATSKSRAGRDRGASGWRPTNGSRLAISASATGSTSSSTARRPRRGCYGYRIPSTSCSQGAASLPSTPSPSSHWSRRRSKPEA